jgi:Ca-activated chloride channel family protein
MNNLEYSNITLAVVGIIALMAWLVDFFHLFKKAELTLPKFYFENKRKHGSTLKKYTLLIIGIAGWLLISIALAQPRKPIGKSHAKQEMNDIYFVVDVSRSMLAEDFSPNRLEAAKDRIRSFVKMSPVDRIGIISFADNVFTLIPATTDLSLVAQAVEQINVGFLGAGTNIGDALGLAIARSKGSIAENKSIILLTDGASNVGLMSPQQAAEKAKESNIKIHTIGIGGDKNARLPTRRDAFGRMQYSSIPGGSMDFKALVEISEISGGKSFVASDPNGLENVLAEIDKLERKKVDVGGRVIYEELYWSYFILGFLLVLITEVGRRYLLREVQ